MPPKTKRSLTTREDRDNLSGSSPAKRLRAEGSLAALLDGRNGVDSPAQIDEPEDREDEREAIEIAPVPIIDGLYLETVPPSGRDLLTKGESIYA